MASVIAFSLHAQNPATETFTLAGRVTNSITGEPVKRAMITATSLANRRMQNPGERGAPVSRVNRNVFSDAEGAFRFTDLPARTYYLVARKPQFEAERIPNIALNASRENLELKVTPYGAVEGTVLDADGSPVIGANILALRKRIANGTRTVDEERSVTTDDRGKYRLWNLASGAYYIRAAGLGGVTSQVYGDQPRRSWNLAFLPVYHGGAHELASATAIKLRAGQQVQADFQLEMLPAFRITGSVTGLTADQKVHFELLAGPNEKASNHTSYNARTGTFQMNDVVAGSYTLRATSGDGGDERRAEAFVRVAGADVYDVVLPLTPAVALTGSTECDRDEKQSTKAARCSAVIQLVDASGELHPDTGDGKNWSIGGLFPGEYRLRVHAFGGYVVSVSAGGAGFAADQRVVIQPGVAPPHIHVRMRSDGGTVKVVLDVPKRSDDLIVLLLPPSVGHEAIRTTTTSQAHCTFTDLAPGRYEVYAVSAAEDIEYSKAEVMRGYTPVEKVDVQSQSQQEITIRSLSR